MGFFMPVSHHEHLMIGPMVWLLTLHVRALDPRKTPHVLTTLKSKPESVKALER